jgi:hypothetical protein
MTVRRLLGCLGWLGLIVALALAVFGAVRRAVGAVVTAALPPSITPTHRTTPRRRAPSAALAAALTLCALIVFLPALRQAILSEATAFAFDVFDLNQSFSFSGQSNCQSSTAGSAAVDVNDHIFLRSVGAIGAKIEPPPCD